jgi:hypothetical protein
VLPKVVRWLKGCAAFESISDESMAAGFEGNGFACRYSLTEAAFRDVYSAQLFSILDVCAG